MLTTNNHKINLADESPRPTQASRRRLQARTSLDQRPQRTRTEWSPATTREPNRADRRESRCCAPPCTFLRPPCTCSGSSVPYLSAAPPVLHTYRPDRDASTAPPPPPLVDVLLLTPLCLRGKHFAKRISFTRATPSPVEPQ